MWDATVVIHSTQDLLVIEVKNVNGQRTLFKEQWVDLFATIRNRLAHHSPYLVKEDFQEMMLLGYGTENDTYETIFYKFFHMLSDRINKMACS